MLGYITCETAELKVKDYKRYGAYYCGVCKALGRRYGQLPRALLSYDSAFLATLLAGLHEEETSFSEEHCMIHPVQKKLIGTCEEIDYAADVMLILAWYKTEDDVADEGGVKAQTAKQLMKPYFRKVYRKMPELCDKIKEGIQKLSALEAKKSASIDLTGDAFGDVMRIVLTGYSKTPSSAVPLLDNIGRALGRWIYLMDAWEDIEENIEKRTYNPLLYRFEFGIGDHLGESKEDFRKRIYDVVKENLEIRLAEAANAFEALEMKKNREIIDNIIYLGLLRKTDRVLAGETEKGELKRR